ncbi:MAG: pseudouridine synthase [Bacteroidetes bacterium]|jgi:23S rRNA pseudouridine2605 synthase|nr:pseudouridine synthase [Bacteroidota bacterium]
MANRRNDNRSNRKKKRPRPGSKSGRAKRSSSSPKGSNTASQKKYLRDKIRLNKYIAHAGFCSRREADDYIAAGKVKVNGKVTTELGSKVKQSDNVEVEGQTLSLEPFTYILLNKGKDTISTTDDEKNRNTVLDAVEDATGHRVYPVGRLDRNTMGLLILTNDGDLAHRLMHPSYRVKKTYEVTTDRRLNEAELREMLRGIELEDGPAKPAEVKEVVNLPNTIQISVFEGRNHLIRRMISYFGAEVTKLKRIRYAGLNDKDIRVGRWRFLRQKEINDLRRLVKLDTLEFNKD